MRRLILIGAFVVAAAFAASTAVPAEPAITPAASALVAKMIAAYGGRAALGSIKSIVQVATFSLQGETATVTSTRELPDRFVKTVSIPAYHATQTTGFDGAKGWESDGYGHVRSIEGDRLAALRCEAVDIQDALLHPRDDTSLSVKPRTAIGGKELITLLFDYNGCPPTTIYVDPSTFLVARYDDGNETLDFSNYQTGPLGEKYPKNALVTAALGTYYTTVVSLQDNAPVDESIFSIPATPSPSPSGSPSTPAATPAPASTPTASAAPASTPGR